MFLVCIFWWIQNWLSIVVSFSLASLMMADSLHELYQKLSLTEQEKEAICVDLLRLGDTNEQNAKSLVIRVLIDRPLTKRHSSSQCERLGDLAIRCYSKTLAFQSC